MKHTTQDIEEMRLWLIECFSSEDDMEEIEELSEADVVRSIKKYFDGGVVGWYDASTVR